jgi:putative intracellular protease/amidase
VNPLKTLDRLATILAVAAFAAAALIATAAHAAPAAQVKPATRTVAIVLYEGVELLDFAGPTEVFQSAARIGAREGVPAFKVYTVSASTAPLRSLGVVQVTPEHSFADAPRPDIVLIPGGGGTLFERPDFQAWLKKVSADAELTVTVCTGAFALAGAGMLDGLEATTFYRAVDHLQQMAPKARVEPGRRFVDSGKVVTTAGVSAGIDGSLHVVARLLGRWVADQTARYMEYHWTPEPYLAAHYSYLTPGLDERGQQSQVAEIALAEGRPADAAKAFRALVQASPAPGPLWARLGLASLSAGDVDGAIPALEKATAVAESRAHAHYNLACAWARKGNAARALDHLRQAAEAGMPGLDYARHDPDLAPIRADPRFEQILSRP